MPERTYGQIRMKETNTDNIKISNDIKCAEIKSIPSLTDKKPAFKIGEYNRATASFEMNGDSSAQKSKIKPEFVLNSEISSNHYFQSSFARSMATSQSKSLDYAYLNKNRYMSAAAVPEEETAVEEKEEETYWHLPGKENWDLRRAQPSDTETTHHDNISNGHNDTKMAIQDQHNRQSFDRPGSRGSSSYRRSISSYSDRRFEDVLLRSPLTSSCRSRPLSSASDVDTVILQSQITTLQWQLRQAEASRQMYRAVMEQVVSFLHKTHKNLEALQTNTGMHTLNRFPRSRSVHTVDTSPSRSESSMSFHRAKSIAQIGDPDCPKHGSAIREMTWRQARKQSVSEQVLPNKLSEEAFRLLRTVQSLLSTKEPDLTQRLNGLGSCSEGSSSPPNLQGGSSASSTASVTLDHLEDPSQETLRNGSVLNLTRNRKSIDSITSKNSLPDDGLQSAFGGHCSPIPGLSAVHIKDATRSLSRRKNKRNTDLLHEGKGSPPQTSISSADDESGFSSLNSFQEIGLPLLNSTMVQNPMMKKPPSEGNYQEVGIPTEDNCKLHRRWSTTPADHHLTKMRPASLCSTGDVIRVLWV